MFVKPKDERTSHADAHPLGDYTRIARIPLANSRMTTMKLMKSRLRRRIIRRLTVHQKLWLSEVRHGETEFQQRLRQGLPARFSDDGPGLEATQAHDCISAQASNLHAVRSALSAGYVDFVEIPRRSKERPRLVVPRAQLRRTLTALNALSDDEWQRDYKYRAWALGSRRAQASDPFSINTITCRRRVVAPNGRVLSTGAEEILIEAWADLLPRRTRDDGSNHIPGTLHRVTKLPRTKVEYFTPDTWEASLANDNYAVTPSAPHLYDAPRPIDLVYTWVDGSDPAWRERKARAEAACTGEEINETAVSESRFADRRELMFSLRSVEAYASWINHIYIITDAQIPAWLNTDHPKITVVDHKDIFTDPSKLPVFNSHAIESQLHHIPGLSEHYLYMNDDMFFMRPTSPELFFTGNGLSKFFPSTAPLDLSDVSARDLPVLSAAKNGREFILSEHGRNVSNKFKHTPYPQLKSVMEEFESSHQSLFDTVAGSTFRHPDDYSITSALYHFHAYAQGKAINSTISYAYMDIARPDAELYMRRLLRRTKLDVLCLNDTDSSPETQNHLDRIVGWFLTEKFSLPSSFETTASNQRPNSDPAKITTDLRASSTGHLLEAISPTTEYFDAGIEGTERADQKTA